MASDREECCGCLFFIIIIVIISVFISSYYRGEKKITFNEQFEIAKSLYNRNNYEEALKTFPTAFGKSFNCENKTNFFYHTALTYIAFERYEEAKNNLNHAKSLISKCPLTLNINTPLADSFYALKEYSKAEQHYKTAISLYPNDAYHHYRLASLYYSLEQYNDAIKYANKAIQLNSAYLYPYILLAESNKALGLNDTAIDHYLKAISLYSNEAYIYYRLGSLYYSLERYNDAIIQFNKAIELNPAYSRPSTYILLAESNNRLGLNEVAIDHYKEAISFNPNDSDLHYQLFTFYKQSANSFTYNNNKVIQLKSTYLPPSTYISHFELNNTMGGNDIAIEHSLQVFNNYIYNESLFRRLVSLLVKDYTDGINYINEAVKLSSHFPFDVYILLAKANVASNQSEIAIDHYHKAISIKPNVADLYYRLASLYHSIKRYDDAIEYANKAIQLNSAYSRPSTYILLAESNIGLGLNEIAIDHYKKAISISPKDPDLYYRLGSLYYSLKLFNDAITYASIAIQLNSSSSLPSTYVLLAESYIGLGLNEIAINHYKKAISIKPKDPDLYYRLGALNHSIKRFNNTVILLSYAIELDQSYSQPSTYILLAESNIGRKEYEMAINHYLKAISLSPNDADLHYRLGSLYHSIKRYNDAIIHLNRAVQLSSDFPIDVYILLAESNVAIHQYDIAIDHYKKAISIRPNDADLHYRLGSLYYSIKRFNDAITNFKRLIELEPSL